MKKLKWLAVIIWGAAFLLGVIVFVVRTGFIEPSAVSLVDLPANHLLQAADLQSVASMNAFIGKYLRRHVIKGQTMTPRDVTSTPLLSVEQGPLLLMATPTSSVGTDVEAQKKGVICRDSNIVASAEAVAILCAPKEEGGRCLALVRAQTDEMKKLAEVLVKEGHVNFWFKADCNK